MAIVKKVISTFRFFLKSDFTSTSRSYDYFAIDVKNLTKKHFPFRGLIYKICFVVIIRFLNSEILFFIYKKKHNN